MSERLPSTIALAALLISVPALAQTGWRCGPTPSDFALSAEDSVLAARYAPIYWYGPGERYLPTVPFFTAFDGVDNDGDGAVDFADPSEIAPPWEKLDTLYFEDDAESTQKIARSAILFRVCDLTADEVQAMWRYVKSDEQAWHRLDIRPDTLAILRQVEVTDDNGAVIVPATAFRVVQYFAFSLHDYGLQGHHYDSELVYVFVPRDTTLAGLFRIVVGGGHTQRIPNNVLVLSGAIAAMQSGVDARPSVLVELGDHSSSPDRPPYGEFAPGLDANWHNYDLWGTRDVQSSSGLGALGPYQTWMTFPRNPRVAMRLFPPMLSASSAAEMTQIQLEGTQEIAQYSLLPVEPFAELYRRIADFGSPPSAADVESALARIVELAHRRWGGTKGGFADAFSGFANLNETEQNAAIAEMQRWFQSPNTLANHYIWETEHYTRVPSRIFKQHLFRPTFNTMSFPVDYLRQLNFSVGWNPGRLLLQTGWDVAAFWLPVRIQGYLSLQGGVYARCTRPNSCFAETSPAFSLVHTGHYSSLFSWYVRSSWIPRKVEVDRTTDVSDWLVGGGVALATSNSVRVRFGLVGELRHKGPLLGRTVVEAQFVWQPFRRGIPGVEAAPEQSNPSSLTTARPIS